MTSLRVSTSRMPWREAPANIALALSSALISQRRLLAIEIPRTSKHSSNRPFFTTVNGHDIDALLDRGSHIMLVFQEVSRSWFPPVERCAFHVSVCSLILMQKRVKECTCQGTCFGFCAYSIVIYGDVYLFLSVDE